MCFRATICGGTEFGVCELCDNRTKVVCPKCGTITGKCGCNIKPYVNIVRAMMFACVPKRTILMVTHSKATQQ